MEYKVLNKDLVDKYIRIYQNAKNDGNEIQCLIGIDSRYRMTTRDSYLDCMTDPDVVFEYCLYPMYLSGDTGVKKDIEEELIKMSNSNDVLEVFQAFRFVMSQDMLNKVYINIPFLVDFTEISKILMARINEFEAEMKNYEQGNVDIYGDSLWDEVERIIRKSTTFKTYLK